MIALEQCRTLTNHHDLPLTVVLSFCCKRMSDKLFRHKLTCAFINAVRNCEESTSHVEPDLAQRIKILQLWA